MNSVDRLLELLEDERRTVKKRRTGWHQSGTLTTGGNQPVSMQIDFGEADTYTLGFLQPFGDGNDAAVRAEALVMWNVNGAYVPTRVSVVGGMALTAAAQGVKVILTDATPATTSFLPAGTAYQVSVQVARGSRGNSSSPPFFVPKSLQTPVSVNGGGTSSAIAVPYDAGIQSIAAAATSNPTGTQVTAGQAYVRCEAQSANGGGAATLLAAYDLVTSPGFNSIPPGTSQVKFVNAAGAAVNFSAVFGVNG